MIFSQLFTGSRKMQLFVTSFGYVQELPNIINYFKCENITCEVDYDNAASKLIRKTDEDAKAYGRNHWRIVINYDAATSPVFKSYIMSQLNLTT